MRIVTGEEGCEFDADAVIEGGLNVLGVLVEMDDYLSPEVYSAMLQLDRETRSVLLYRWLWQIPLRQAAKELGMSSRKVKDLDAKGREKMKELLSG